MNNSNSFDKNLIVETKLNKDDIKFYSVLSEPFRIYGLTYDHEDKIFKRIPTYVLYCGVPGSGFEYTYTFKLEVLSKNEQVLEIEENMNLLIENGLIDENLCSIAFPFGSFNDETLEIMQEKKIKYGFKVNEEGIESDLLINRIDCNQLKNMIIKE